MKSSEIAHKYPQDTREIKAIAFSKLKHTDQLDALILAVTGIKSEAIEEKERLESSNLIIGRINHYLGKLQKIGKHREWVSNTCDPAIVVELIIEEQIKYHDSLIRFYNNMSGESENKGTAFPVEPDKPDAKPPNLDSPEWKEI